MAQWVKNLPAVQETQETRVQSPGWEDPREKEMATHSSILGWKIPQTEEPGGPHSPQCDKEWDTTERLISKKYIYLKILPYFLKEKKNHTFFPHKFSTTQNLI